jgi:superkiller protein 3
LILFFCAIYFYQGDAVKALSIAQSAVVAAPSSSSARRDVASLLLKQGNPASAFAILSSQPGDDLDHERQTIGLRAIAASTNNVNEAIKLAQKAVRMIPWQIQNWQVLAYVRGAGASAHD